MRIFMFAAMAALVPATTVLAHVTLEQTTSPQGAVYKAVVRIGHGCDGETTQRVRVRIPEGVIAVKPMAKPGWALDTLKGPYDKEYDYFGTKVTEGVKEVVWTGELPDGHYDEFIFRGIITDTFAIGSTVYFPVVQECAGDAERWIEIPTEGQDPEGLENPAPGVMVVEPKKGH